MNTCFSIDNNNVVPTLGNVYTVKSYNCGTTAFNTRVIAAFTSYVDCKGVNRYKISSIANVAFNAIDNIAAV